MTRKTRRAPAAGRSAARLAAVQALYDAEMTGTPVEELLKDFLDHEIGRRALVQAGEDETAETEVALVDPDPILLAQLVRGGLAEAELLDTMIGQALTGEWSVERLESVLHAILRAGAFELMRMPETPARVVITEYVDVAGAFYGGPEPGLANAVLDRIARVVRAEELAGKSRA